MATISREALIERAQTRRSAEREIGGLGTVVVRELSVREMSEFRQRSVQAVDDPLKQSELSCWFATIGLAEPVLAEDDVALLMDADNSLVEELCKAIMLYNGMDIAAAQEQVEAAKKNSKTTR